MKNNLTTEAGQTKQRDQRVDTINQVFALLKLNYHNQFYRAFANEADLNSAKRLWFDSLSQFSSAVILKGVKTVIESSEFLPTLRTMIQACEEQSESGLPDAHAAYIEACRAPSPKAEYNWSHPAIYYAGKATDWFFLQSNAENVAFPAFKQEYEKISRLIRQGVVFEQPRALASPDSFETPLSNDENKKRIDSLRSKLDL